MALVYANDGEPGIRRRRAGTGFDYLWPDGRERSAIARCWSGSGGSSSRRPGPTSGSPRAPEFHLQVTGKDVRGRKQYRYHERWNACRDEVKYSNLIEFARALPRLRQAVEADLGRRGLAREKVVATVVRLLDTTMIRVGNAAYARDNGSFGLTTFRDRHVRVEGSNLRLSLQGQVGQGMAAEGDGSPDRPDRQGDAGSAGTAPLPVCRRGGRAAAGHLERRERLYPHGRGGTLFVEALPHLGRHGPGAPAVLGARAARDETWSGRRHEQGNRRRLRPARQHADAYAANAMSIRWFSRAGRKAGSPRRLLPSDAGSEGRRRALAVRSTLLCGGWRRRWRRT